MITARGKLIIILFFTSLLFAYYTQWDIFYISVAFFVLLLITSFLFYKLVSVRLSYKRRLPAESYEGEKIEVKVSIENGSFIPWASLYISDYFGPEREGLREKNIFFACLPYRQKFFWIYRGECYKRGEYIVGPLRIQVGDIFGVFERRIVLYYKDYLVVYPSLFEVNNFPIFIRGLTTRFGSQTMRRAGEYEEFAGIREYHLQDGLKKIHWRSTARLGKLIVKYFEYSASYAVNIILDLKAGNDIGEGKDTTLEYQIKIAASLARYLILRNIPTQIIGRGDRDYFSYLGDNEEHLHKILRMLAVMKAEGKMSLSEFLAFADYLVSSNSTLVIFTLDREAQSLSSLLEMVQYKKNSVVRFVFDTESFYKKLSGDKFDYEPRILSSDFISFNVKKNQKLSGFFKKSLVEI